METEKGKPEVHKLISEEDVAVALAKYIADLSDKSVKGKGSFSVALSGGSLIHTLRVVPLDDPDSNYKLAYDGFLSKIPIPPGNVYAINDTLSPEGAADEYEARLKDLVKRKTLSISVTNGFPKLDLMLVGMGPEGHVASLFCWHFQRYEKKRWVTFIKDSPKPPSKRITFTFPVINSASNVAMVITGEDLASAVKVALGTHSSDFIPLPVQMVLPEGELTWLSISVTNGFPKLDLMLVGMGPEGHVASLFCWHFQRYEKKRWVTFIKDSPKPPSKRITFTFPVINSASNVAMVITGEDLASAVKVALGTHSSDFIPLPVQMVLPEGELTWFLDMDAASKL
ncbi:hypothetical protein RJ640_028356 [Escallonia rubra]|uniref:Glucosamine/galactosamine-6-phosphate isomerase domain-containing protein n=1 Tax=Escallonia rubra TaxID=112253 RepID=A0AA88QMQ7_9ASTE|nr:hypothetical protein RJ640_028356 [Escallonia rubra]